MADYCDNCKVILPEKIKKWATYCNDCYDKGIQFYYQIPSTTSFEGSRNTTIGLLNTTVSNTLSCVATLQLGYLTAEITGFMAVLKKTH